MVVAAGRSYKKDIPSVASSLHYKVFRRTSDERSSLQPSEMFIDESGKEDASSLRRSEMFIDNNRKVRSAP
jgi:hypothetical protein